MLLLLLLIVGLAVVIVLSAIKSIKDDCDCEIRKVEQRYARLHELKLRTLEQEYKELQQKIYYEQREKILQEESEQIKAQAKANYQEYYDSLIAAAEAETALKIQNLNAFVREKSEAAAQHRAELEAKRAELDAEIADLQRRKDAAIEIVKQEEAVNGNRSSTHSA